MRETAERLEHLRLDGVGQVKLEGFVEARMRSRATKSDAESGD